MGVRHREHRACGCGTPTLEGSAKHMMPYWHSKFRGSAENVPECRYAPHRTPLVVVWWGGLVSENVALLVVCQ